MNVVDYLMENKAANGDTALLTLQGSHSYGELRESIDVIAGYLIDAGAEVGDRILILAENSLFWVAGYLGAIKAGCVSVPVAPNLKSEDLEYIIASCKIKTALVHSKITREQLLALPPGARIVSDVAIIDRAGCEYEFVTVKDLPESHGSTIRTYPEIDEPKSLAAIMFTSGSTGKPRGVMISHRNIIANTSSIVEYMELTERDRIMAVLPFYYCFGTSLLHTHLRAGASVVIDPRFMFADKVLARMRETRCTGFAGVPSHYQILLRKSSFSKMQFPDLRYVQQAGGKLPDKLIRELRDAVPATKVFIMYGQTEATSRLSFLSPDALDTKLGSVGRGIPRTRLQVLDQNGAQVLPGEIGEIVAEGENVALGYWEATDEDCLTFRDSCLRTGDLATVDDDGFIFIVDRSKDILKCGGKRTSCKEVEDALLEFEGLVEAAVISVPDELLGEAAKAFVVPHANDRYLVDRLRTFCEERFPSHLIPREIVVLDELPKSNAGKIMKSVLKSMN